MAKRPRKPKTPPHSSGTSALDEEIALAAQGWKNTPTPIPYPIPGAGGAPFAASGPMGEPPLTKLFTGKGAGGGIETLLAAAGVTDPGMLQKMAAGLVNKTPLGKYTRATAGGAKLGMGGKVGAWVGKNAVAHPVNSALGALFALQMLAPGLGETVTSPWKSATGGDSMVDNFLNTVGVQGQPTFGNRLKNQGQLLALQDEMRMRAQRDARTSAQNTALLFQTAPHVAAQIMAGRRLPKGAVVIGGTPRVDLMQEMAQSMGQGQFETPDVMQQMLERQQGGAL